MRKKKFYITTTLPYVNAEPHIGFALEIVQADLLARYHRLQGEDVFFNTGTDEHGLKIYRRALEEGKEPQRYVDEYAAKFDNLKKALNLSYNSFIRTTDKHHIQAAREFWKRCQKNGDIYKDKQKIKYCVGCELEKTESELVDNKCPIHPNKKLEIIEEENYFFRFSKYQKPLLGLYEKNPDFVIPRSRLKEIKNFVAGGLRDFSVSRLRSKLPWGVEVPGDPNHVMYVWFDALINYISAIGWPHKMEEFNNWWPGVQTAGKDNLRQQSAMWQAMLTSAGLPTSKQILIHGFITSGGQKMSKSLGNVVDPFELVDKYGTDAVRYYLLKEIPPTKDGDFSIQRFKELYNADLANGLGNLVQRATTLAQKYFDGKIPTGAKNPFREPHIPFVQKELQTWKDYDEALKNYRFNDTLFFVLKFIKTCDKYIDQEKPWELAKQKDKKDTIQVVFNLLESLHQIAWLLWPFVPGTSREIAKRLNIKPLLVQSPRVENSYQLITQGAEVTVGQPLFPRI